ncbi:hypothetical protein HGRIS_006306 [Hohenbuehelia grisea]|uniref:Uncharacterized protein n=1 Tax=Hohenbuehelia grisea TaxID=104357 RepID=A0ABR3K166_9AGAR
MTIEKFPFIEAPSPPSSVRGSSSILSSSAESAKPPMTEDLSSPSVGAGGRLRSWSFKRFRKSVSGVVDWKEVKEAAAALSSGVQTTTKPRRFTISTFDHLKLSSLRRRESPLGIGHIPTSEDIAEALAQRQKRDQLRTLADCTPKEYASVMDLVKQCIQDGLDPILIESMVNEARSRLKDGGYDAPQDEEEIDRLLMDLGSHDPLTAAE